MKVSPVRYVSLKKNVPAFCLGYLYVYTPLCSVVLEHFFKLEASRNVMNSFTL